MRDFGLRRGLGWVWGEEKCLLGAPAPEESWESWGKCLPRCRASRCLEKTATYVRPVGTVEPKRPKGLTIGNPELECHPFARRLAQK
ncbi:uncharacterized protein AAG666_022583 isoform 2-T2 [Megaptera novaeangliae]